MQTLLSNKYVKYAFAAIYTLLQCFFIGAVLVWYIPLLHWPFNVVAGYAIGFIFSALIAYVIFSRLKLTFLKKALIASVLLIIVALASTVITDAMLIEAKAHAAEILD